MIMPSNAEVESPKAKKDRNGDVILNIAGVCWYTNLDIKKRHEDLLLYRRHADDPSKYPHYDNYDAIEVSKVKDIPEDYWGVMGVPITFMDSYNPDQFELIGASDNGAVPDEYKLPHFKRHNEPYIDGRKVYKRLFIRRRA